jgi:UDP-N-acetylmuramate dehydrogenase
MVEVHNLEALLTCVNAVRKGRGRPPDLFVLGGGSNLLVSDRGFEGIVLKLGKGFQELIDVEDILMVGAAFPLKELAVRGVREGWGGMEYFAGLPGTVGGAIRMNAGAWGREIWDFVLRVYGVDPTGVEGTVSRSDVQPGYRMSGLDPDFIVTKVDLRYDSEKPSVLRKRLQRFMLRRKKGQVVRAPSFGSVFKNPEGFQAGKLIDSLGLKGTRVGGAVISREHANFIVNLGDARAEDVMALMRKMRRAVLDRYDVVLEPEVVFLGLTESELEGVR